jgi:Tol biopolymer transport system component
MAALTHSRRFRRSGARSYSSPTVTVMSGLGDGLRRQRPAPIDKRGENGSPAWSPDGIKIVFHSRRDYKGGNRAAINVMGADRSDQHRLIGGEGSYPAWSRDGRWIAFMRRSSGGSEIHAVKPDGSELAGLNCHGSNKSDPAWSPS